MYGVQVLRVATREGAGIGGIAGAFQLLCPRKKKTLIIVVTTTTNMVETNQNPNQKHHLINHPQPKAPSHKPPPTTKPIQDIPPSSPPQKGYDSSHSLVFDVMDFGAKGDGITDDTKLMFNMNC